MLTIKAKIIVTNCVSLILLIALSLVVSSVLDRNSSVVQTVNSLEYPSLNLAATNLGLLKEASERFNIAVTIGEEELLAQNLQVKDAIAQNLQQILSYKPELSAKVAALRNDSNHYFSSAHQLAKSMIDGSADMSKAAGQAQENSALYERLHQQFDAFYTLNNDSLTTTIEDLVADNATTESVVQFACVVGVLVIATIAFFLVSGITRDLRLITDKMKDISSGDGDLRARLDYNKDDELKELVTYFNRFVTKLHDNISNVVRNTHSLSTISSNLLEANQSAKQISEQQLGAMDQVASAVMQMAHVATDISANANDTARAVNSAMNLSQKGASTVQQTLTALDLLVTDVKKTSSVVAELNESTKSAESILLAINAIAEQTNLLALNAAIEAARAGEQGRGFAVVADEVRTLASRTQSSTREIQAVLEGLQGKADQAMGIIRNSLHNAELCNEKSFEAEQTIKSVADNMSDIDQRNILVATATEEQGQTTKEMESHVLNIQVMSQQVANSLQQVDDMVQSIETVKEHLMSVTEQFKTH